MACSSARLKLITMLHEHIIYTPTFTRSCYTSSQIPTRPRTPECPGHSIYICYMHICNIRVYIYIYICMHLHMCIHIYIYIYIYQDTVKFRSSGIAVTHSSILDIQHRHRRRETTQMISITTQSTHTYVSSTQQSSVRHIRNNKTPQALEKRENPAILYACERCTCTGIRESAGFP